MARALNGRPSLAGILLLAVAFLFGGCSSGSGGAFGILSGVLAWSRQDWALAASSFLDASSRAEEEGNAPFRDYAVYGLAATYLAADEYEAALSRLSALASSESPQIRSGLWYQAGIIAYRKGEFDKAAEFFRSSLENDPSSMDAKINLELSRRSLSEQQSRKSGTAPGISENGDASHDAEAIFNLVRRKEQERWKNQENPDSPPASADY